MRPQRKHTLSVVSFPPPLPLLIRTRFSENLLAAPDFQAVQLSIFTFHRFVIVSMMIAFFVTQISHHHWSKTASATVNCCAVTSFSRSVKHMESKIASRMPLDNWSPVRFSGDVVPKFPLGWCAGGRLFWRLSVETRSACCRPDFSTNLCHCSKPGSRSAPRTTSRASPLVLEIKKMLQILVHLVRHTEWSISSVTLNSCCRCVAAIGCFQFSAAVIACFSATCITPTKSLARNDQVLQLEPFLFPNWSGIKVLGSTNRTRDLVSTVLRGVVNS